MISNIINELKIAANTLYKQVCRYKYILAILLILHLSTTFQYMQDWHHSEWWHGLKPRVVYAAIVLFIWALSEHFCRKKNISFFSTTKLATIVLIFGLYSFTNLDIRSGFIPGVEITINATALFLVSYAILRGIALIPWAIFFFIITLQMISWHTMRITLSASVISEMLHASGAEIQSFLSPQNIVILSILAAAILLSLSLLHLCCRKTHSAKLLSSACFLFLFFYAIGLTLPHSRRANNKSWIISSLTQLCSNFEDAANRNIRLIKRISQLPSASEKPSSLDTISSDDKVVYILHIGESVRSNHLGINGYNKPTTPWLSTQKRLINFPRCISSACDTCDSLSVILTNATASIAHPETEYHSSELSVGAISDIFKSHNFYVSYHAGYNHLQHKKEAKGLFCPTFSLLFHEFAQKADNLQESPGSVMSQCEQIIKLCKEHEHDNMFIVINNEGSHEPFSHYDHNHPTFTPSNHTSIYSTETSIAEHIINAYDNTIVHTDTYIQKLINSLQNRPFVYMYVSDHGESLGYDSNGIMGRGWINSQPDIPSYLKTFQQNDICVVPLFILTSPEFEKLHPHFAKALAQLQANTGLTAGHGHIFHTILGLFNVQTPHYRAEWDLCSDKVQPYSGPRPDSVIAAEKAQTQH